MSHAVRTSKRPVNVAMTLLGGVAPLMSGAKIGLFPGHLSPLNILALQVGYPQTRKSQTTALLKTMGECLDAHIHARCVDI
eukprot:10951231-Lingulodinium_polyedra.AAC.1